jgi:histidinol-phosphatase (PHP family)
VIDLHLHTARCRHAEGGVTEYVEAARRAGVETMCFTDHMPLPDGYPGCYSMTWPEFPDYVAEVRAAARAAGELGGPEVLCGVEADWLPGQASLVAGLATEHDLDLVLGSVHFVEGWAFDDPDEIEHYAEWDVEALWERYFEQVAAAASSGFFDVMAHPDLVKKFGFIPEADPQPWYEETASVLASAGVAVEVNTAGLRKPVREIYPSLAFLETCRRRGVPATTGSDAHTPSDVGAGMTPARELLMRAGYDSVVVFRHRVPQEVAL